MSQQHLDKRSQLLLAALQRAGKPVGSDDVLDAVTGLALNEGWVPEQLRDLTRKSVSKRLQNMETAGLVKRGAEKIDPSARRPMPTYMPVGGYDAKAPIPAPDGDGGSRAPTRTTYDGMSRTQLIAVLEAHDDVLECVGRFFHDLARVREKAMRRLAAAGLERGQ